MTDLTLTGVAIEGDELVLAGTGFTKTTTTVYAGENGVPFDWVSDTKIKIAMVEAGTPIYAAKGDMVSDEIASPDGGAPAAPEAGSEADKIETNPVEATEPYPTGSPPDPAEEYFKIHGRYPAAKES